jgi:ribosome maturation factor RimP
VVHLHDGAPVSGRLTAVERTEPDDGTIVVVPVTPGLKGRKPVVGEPVRVPLSEVRAAHVEVDLTGVGPVDDDEAGSDADAGQES